jgi:hypothetical protein
MVDVWTEEGKRRLKINVSASYTYVNERRKIK